MDDFPIYGRRRKGLLNVSTVKDILPPLAEVFVRLRRVGGSAGASRLENYSPPGRPLADWFSSVRRWLVADPVLLAPVLVLAAATRFLEVGRPFFGHHDFHTAFFTLGGAGRRLGEYTNWPPLTDAFYGLSLFLFGQEEWAVRVLPILLSLGTIVLVYLIGKEIFNTETGLLAALLLAILPGDIYFARIVTFTFFIALTIWAYHRWLVTRRSFYLIAAVSSNLVGLGFSYAAVPIAGLPNLLLAIRYRDFGGQGAMVGSTVLAVAAWFGYLWVSDGLDSPRAIANDDNVTVLANSGDRQWWLDSARLFTRQMFTPIPVFMSILWVASLLFRRSLEDLVLLLWALAAFGWLLLFPIHSRDHDMWWLPLAAPLALVVARGVFKLAAPWPEKIAPVLLVIAFTAWFSVRATDDFFDIGDPTPTAVELGQDIGRYLDEDDRIIGYTPKEIWYSGAEGYIWAQIGGEEGYLDVLAKERPAMILPVTFLEEWQPRNAWQSGYIPLMRFSDWLVYFRPDKAELAAADDPGLAATLTAVRSVPDGSFLGSGEGPSIYYLKWGLRMLIGGSEMIEVLGLTDADIRFVADETLDAIPEGVALPHVEEGSAIKGSRPSVFLLIGGQKRLIPNASTFEALGLSVDAVRSLPDGLVERIPAGADIDLSDVARVKAALQRTR